MRNDVSFTVRLVAIIIARVPKNHFDARISRRVRLKKALRQADCKRLNSLTTPSRKPEEGFLCA